MLTSSTVHAWISVTASPVELPDHLVGAHVFGSALHHVSGSAPVGTGPVAARRPRSSHVHHLHTALHPTLHHARHRLSAPMPGRNIWKVFPLFWRQKKQWFLSTRKNKKGLQNWVCYQVKKEKFQSWAVITPLKSFEDHITLSERRIWAFFELFCLLFLQFIYSWDERNPWRCFAGNTNQTIRRLTSQRSAQGSENIVCRKKVANGERYSCPFSPDRRIPCRSATCEMRWIGVSRLQQTAEKNKHQNGTAAGVCGKLHQT